ncbi:PaaI family thioesterase [Halococcus saccharolyticus]|uniref:Thioesterase superfamily protein n=1 Tax=Halococcus saccharolyticus DSM 5350 TaxID=1227455 RepID=M0MN40_9EURY|nr:PaaI family thioesterase [Halococcus saccharolyticus]EMA46159.1 thioesterase superfamily protein [Halococcus saccharolyticus DSM 5350]
MIDETDDAAAFLQAYIDDHGYLSWLGTQVESMEHDRLVMTIPFDEKLTNTRPNGDDDATSDIHGGIAATLIDTAGGIALRPALDDPMSDGVATINLNVNYLRPAGGDLIATADVIRAGSTVGVSTVTVESEAPDGEMKPVATGQGAYRLFRG